MHTIGLLQRGGLTFMSSVGKTIKIIKRKKRESLADQAQGFLQTDKQSRREMIEVVASWIRERKELSKERARTKEVVFGPR
jgi:hypothetical protein